MRETLNITEFGIKGRDEWHELVNNGKRHPEASAHNKYLVTKSVTVSFWPVGFLIQNFSQGSLSKSVANTLDYVAIQVSKKIGGNV